MVEAGITTLVISKSASAMFTMNALPVGTGRGNGEGHVYYRVEYTVQR